MERRHFSLANGRIRLDCPAGYSKSTFIPTGRFIAPGQTIYFRAVLRNSGDARYQPTVLEDVEFKLMGDYNIDTGQPTVIDTVNLQVSPYGTVNGVFDLPEDVPPGNYTIQLIDGNAWLNLQVAEYRKPEIDVQVNFSVA